MQQLWTLPKPLSPNHQHKAICTDTSDHGFSFMQLAAKKQQTVPHTWVLFDNQSTVDVFCNSGLLINIQKAATSLDIHCNLGSTTTDMEGDLLCYGTVQYHPSRITNILSLERVWKQYHITFDSKVGNRLLVTKPDGTTFEFKESPTGLYYMDAEAQVQQQAQVHVNTMPITSLAIPILTICMSWLLGNYKSR